ncbi:MAG: hypothetical protein JXA22_01135 [Candidatus Thermoplasmatota archaeon]|nr:hypothetical protein [Candidatus Thermoplasmatota archaeon]
MASSNFFERLDIVKAVIIFVILVNATVWGLVAIYFLTGKEVSSLEDDSPWKDVIPTEGGVPKSDSDTRLINNEYINWPDKLSDIEENYIYGTDWRQPDSDHDGIEDGWEALYSRPNPITERLTIDPNEKDWDGNPDGDGFDLNNNGVIDKQEELFNLREYVGGVEFNWTTNTFEKGDPTFGELDPEVDWQEIGMKGGFHLYDNPDDGIVGDPTNIDNDNFDDYLSYNPYIPSIYKPVTTNPSLWDTDLDGIDDGWETNYARELKNMFFDQGETIVYEGSINQYQEATVVAQKQLLQVTSSQSVPWDTTMIDPLNPSDAKYDLDIRYGVSITAGQRTSVMIYTKDDLTNLQEYQNHTSPLLWDTDGDSHFNALKGVLYLLNDFIELSVNYTESSVDWNGDGIIDYKTCPYKSDSDGDGMWDGWELETGLNPLNSTDRFKDLDNDGLPNYLENAFPNKENLWFQTDPKNPDTDGDGMLDGWEAYNAKIISQTPATSTRDDLEDKIADTYRTVFTVTPMIPDSEEDNDGWWNITDSGDVIYTRIPDGMTNLEEFQGTPMYRVSTNPNEPDSDFDGLMDGEELKQGFYGELIGDNYFTDPEFAAKYFTNATMADSDNDFGGSDEIKQVGNVSRTLNDWEETRGRTSVKITYSNGFDDDGDGWIDEEGGEYLLFSPTNATNPDTDLDGWMDVDELFGIDSRLLWDQSKYGVVRTDPNKKDTDNDQMSDYDELKWIPNYREWITDPNDPDTDNDGMEDGLENTVDFFPLIDWEKNDNHDANDDGDYSDTELGDIWSTDDRTNPTKIDTDGDRLPDGWEYRFGKVVKSDKTKSMILWYDRIYRTNYWQDLPVGGSFWMVNPLIAADVFDDPDNDGLTNWQEYQNGTHPLMWDTDGDGMPDGWELQDENRGSPLYNPEKRKHAWILDPLNGEDWCLDADHDGFVYAIWTPLNSQKSEFELVNYYFPWINLYEYQYGLDPDHDGINEITTSPAPRIPENGVEGGKDSDSDGMPDGWEVWVTDYIGNASSPNSFEDNDSLPKGWEELFNGSMWNRPECFIYEENNATWDPWANSQTVGRKVFQPAGIATNKDYFQGRLYSDRRDTDMDGVYDREEDDDSDGKNNFAEYRGHTDATDKDSFPGRANIPNVKTGPSREAPEQGPQPRMTLTIADTIQDIDTTIDQINLVLERIGLQKLSREDIVIFHVGKEE